MCGLHPYLFFWHLMAYNRWVQWVHEFDDFTGYVLEEVHRLACSAIFLDVGRHVWYSTPK
jgi:hypothetical protein